MADIAIPSGIRMLNYFSQLGAVWNPTADPSGTFNATTFAADMDKLKAEGFNSIRLQLGATAGEFTFPTPTSTELTHLQSAYSIMKTKGIKVKLCLFDHWGSYGKFTSSKTWAAAVLGSFPDFTNVLAIELQNEQKFALTTAYDFTNAGYDAGYSTGTPAAATIGDIEIAWTKWMVPYLRTLAPGIPICLSTNGTTGTWPRNDSLVKGVAQLDSTVGRPDWWEFHPYQPSGNSPHIIAFQLVSQAVNVVGDYRRLFLGETGSQEALSGAANGTLSNAQQLNQSADWFQHMRWASNYLLGSEPSPWMMYDMPVGSQNFSSGQNYGLWDTNGNPKPALLNYRANPFGSVVPPVPINADQTGAYTDPNGSVLPYGYQTYRPSSVAITAAKDSSILYNGKQTIKLTGSSGTTTTTPPGIFFDLGDGSIFASPDVTQGSVYTEWNLGNVITLTWAIMATGAWGSPQLGLDWWGTTGFLQGRVVSISPGTTFSDFSIASQPAPTGATMLRCYVKTAGNAGQINVANPRATASIAIPPLSSPIAPSVELPRFFLSGTSRYRLTH